MMPKNSFKKLEEEYSVSFEQRDERVRENVNHSIGFVHFLGDLVDLFIPKVANLFLVASGGKGPNFGSDSDEVDAENRSQTRKYPNRPKY